MNYFVLMGVVVSNINDLLKELRSGILAGQDKEELLTVLGKAQLEIEKGFYRLMHGQHMFYVKCEPEEAINETEHIRDFIVKKIDNLCVSESDSYFVIESNIEPYEPLATKEGFVIVFRTHEEAKSFILKHKELDK